MFIGLCGWKGSGKDTVANFILEELDEYRKTSYAAKLRDVISVMFGYDRIKLEGNTKEDRIWREQVDPWWTEKLGMEWTPRYAMQYVGTNCFRHMLHPDIWVLLLEKRLLEESNLIVSDCRFFNELDLIKKHGGITIHVDNGLPEGWDPAWVEWAAMANKGDAEYYTKMQGTGIHESEWKWIGYEFDYRIENKGTLDELRQKTLDVLRSSNIR